MEHTKILLFLYLDVCLIIGFYMYLRKIKKLIGFQLGMNISVVMGGLVSLLFGVLLIIQFPFHFTLITIIATSLGMITGGSFGKLFDYQTFVTGLTNGMVVGLMSPMIGTVLEMPIVFVWFMHIFFVLSLITILISIKRS